MDPSFRTLSGRLKFTVRRHNFNEDFLSSSRVHVCTFKKKIARVSFDLVWCLCGLGFVS